MIINPWGIILNKLNNEQNILNTSININEVNKVRKKIPFKFND